MTSGFMLFCGDHREKVKTDKPKQTIAQVAKELGRQWQALGEEKKAEYKALAQTRNKNKTVCVKPTNGFLPLHKVKRIMLAEKSVSKISKDSAFIVAKATELFLKELANKAIHSKEKKASKLVTMRDIAEAVHLGAAELHFLRHDVPYPVYNKVVKSKVKEEAKGSNAQKVLTTNTNLVTMFKNYNAVKQP